MNLVLALVMYLLLMVAVGDDHVDRGDNVGLGDHDDDFDEFDKEQPADEFDGGLGDVFVVDDRCCCGLVDLGHAA